MRACPTMPANTARAQLLNSRSMPVARAQTPDSVTARTPGDTHEVSDGTLAAGAGEAMCGIARQGMSAGGADMFAGAAPSAACAGSDGALLRLMQRRCGWG